MKKRIRLKNGNYLDSGSVICDNQDLTKELETINNRLGGLGIQCKMVSGDWNTACGYSTGFYRGNRMLNGPLGQSIDSWWYVIHLVHDEKYAKQIAFSFANNNSLYVRTMCEGLWGDWTTIN